MRNKCAKTISATVIAVLLVLVLVCGFAFANLDFNFGGGAAIPPAESESGQNFASASIVTTDGSAKGDIPAGATPISTEAELKNFIASGGAYGYLVNDVELNYTSTVGAGSSAASNSGYIFNADRTFDGNGFQVNLTTNRDAWGNSSYREHKDIYGYTGRFTGFFVAINRGTIKNTVFNFSSIIKYDYGSYNGYAYNGLICGENAGTIDNIKLNMNGKITIHKNQPASEGHNANNGQQGIGGVAGLNSGTLTNTTVNYGSSAYVENNSKWRSNTSWLNPKKGSARSLIGGVVATAQSYGTYKSVMRNITVTGAAGASFVPKTVEGSNGAGTLYRQVGIVVGGSTVYGGLIGGNYDDEEGIVIDGLLVDWVGNITGSTSGDSTNSVNAVIDCGAVKNTTLLRKNGTREQDNKIDNCGCGHTTNKHNLITNEANLNTEVSWAGDSILRVKVTPSSGYSIWKTLATIGTNDPVVWSDAFSTSKQTDGFTSPYEFDSRGYIYERNFKLSSNGTENNALKMNIQAVITANMKGSVEVSLSGAQPYTGRNYLDGLLQFKNASGAVVSVPSDAYALLDDTDIVVTSLIDPKEYKVFVKQKTSEGAYSNAAAYFDETNRIAYPSVEIALEIEYGNLVAPTVTDAWTNGYAYSAVLNGGLAGAITGFDFSMDYGKTFTRISKQLAYTIINNTAKAGTNFIFRGIREDDVVSGDVTSTKTTIVTNWTDPLLLKIDSVAPSVDEIVSDLDLNVWYNCDIPFDINASDALSGIKDIMVDGVSVNFANDIYSSIFTTRKEYVITAKDMAGNVSANFVYTPNIDKTPLGITANGYTIVDGAEQGYAIGTESEQVVFLNINGAFGLSGATMFYQINGGDWLPLDIDSSGNFIMEVRESASAGDVYNFKIVSNAVDAEGTVNDYSSEYGKIIIVLPPMTFTNSDVTIENLTKIYDATTDFVGTIGFTQSLLNDVELNDLFTIVAEYADRNAGESVNIIITVVPKSGTNFKVINEFEPVEGSIMKKAITVTADDKTKEFGEENPELTATIEGLADAETDDISINLSTLAEQYSSVVDGGYPIIVDSSQEFTNYYYKTRSSITDGTLTITKRIIYSLNTDPNSFLNKTPDGDIISIQAQYEDAYGDLVDVLGVQYFYLGASPEGEGVEVTKFNNAGYYKTVFALTEEESVNYEIRNNAKTLVIKVNKIVANVVTVEESKTHTYDSQAKELTLSAPGYGEGEYAVPNGLGVTFEYALKPADGKIPAWGAADWTSEAPSVVGTYFVRITFDLGQDYWTFRFNGKLLDRESDDYDVNHPYTVYDQMVINNAEIGENEMPIYGDETYTYDNTAKLPQIDVSALPSIYDTSKIVVTITNANGDVIDADAVVAIGVYTFKFEYTDSNFNNNIFNGLNSKTVTVTIEKAELDSSVITLNGTETAEVFNGEDFAFGFSYEGVEFPSEYEFDTYHTLKIEYKGLTDSDYATVETSGFKFINVGSYKLTYTFNNPNYKAFADVTAVYEIAKNLTWFDENLTYDNTEADYFFGKEIAFGITSADLPAGYNADLFTRTIKYTDNEGNITEDFSGIIANRGTYEVTVKFTDSNFFDNEDGEVVYTKTITVGVSDIKEYTWTPNGDYQFETVDGNPVYSLELVYDAVGVVIGYTLAENTPADMISNGAISIDTIVYTVNGSVVDKLEFVDAGEYEINISITRDENYNVYNLDMNVVIEKATIEEFTLADMGKEYNGNAFGYDIYDSIPSFYDADSITISVNGEESDLSTFSEIGVYVIKFSFSDINFNDYADVTYTLTITNGSLDITLDNAAFRYDGSAKWFESNENGLPFELPEGYDTDEISYTIIYTAEDGTVTENFEGEIIALGTYAVTFALTDSNFDATYTVTANIIITTGLIEGYTFENQTVTYNGTAQSLAITETLKAGDSVVYTNNGQTKAGTYKVTATISRAYYDDLVLEAELVIEKTNAQDGEFTLKANAGDDKVYDGTIYNGNNLVNIPNLFDIDGKAVVKTYVKNSEGVYVLADDLAKNVGSYKAVISFINANYNAIEAVEVEFNITKAAGVVLDFDSVELPYNGKLQNPGVFDVLPSGYNKGYVHIYLYNNEGDLLPNLTMNDAFSAVGVYFLEYNFLDANFESSSRQKVKFEITIATFEPTFSSPEFEGDSFTKTYDGISATPQFEETEQYALYLVDGTIELTISYKANADAEAVIITGNDAKAFKAINAGEYTFTYVFENSNFVDVVTIVKTVVIDKYAFGADDFDASAFTSEVTYSGQDVLWDSIYNMLSDEIKAMYDLGMIEITITPKTPQSRNAAVLPSIVDAGEYEVEISFNDPNFSNQPGKQTFTLTVKKVDGTAKVKEGTDSATFDGTAKAPEIEVTIAGNPSVLSNFSTIAIESIEYKAIGALDFVTFEGTEMINAGEYKITYSFENENFNAFENLEVLFNIEQAVSEEILLNDVDATYNGQAYGVDIAAYVASKYDLSKITATVNGEEIDIEDTMFIKAGEYAVVFSFNDSNYKAIENASVTITIAKRVVEADLSVENLVYNKTEKTATATITNGVTGDSVNLTISYSGERTNVTASGFTVNVTSVDNENYELPQTTISKAFVIAPKTLDANITVSDLVFNNSDKVALANLINVIDGDEVAIDSITYTGDRKNVTTSGFTATVSGVDNANYNLPVGGIAKTFVITKAAMPNDITLENKNVTFNGQDYQIDADFFDALAEMGYNIESIVIKVNGNTASVSYDNLVYANAGTYVYSFEFTDTNFVNIEKIEKTLTIAKANVENLPTISGGEKTYDGTAYNWTADFNLPQLYDMSKVQIKVNGQIVENVNIINAGVYNIKYLFLDENFSDIEDITATVTINKATITDYTLQDKTVVYNGAAQGFTIDLVDGDTIVWSNNSNVNAGVYEVSATITRGENFEVLVLEANFTIDKATFNSLTMSDIKVVFDGKIHLPEVVGTVSGVLFDVNYSSNALVNVGTYTVTAVISAENYNTLTLSAKVEIEKRVVKVVISGYDNLVEGTKPNITAKYINVDGVEVNARLDVNQEALDGIKGKYVLKAIIDDANYALSADTVAINFEIKAKANVGLIVGCVAGAVAIILVIGVAVLVLRKKKANN